MSKAEGTDRFDSAYLVETDWLAQNLNDPTLRIFDCTVFLRSGEGGMTIESGRSAWAAGHIPGSGFLDLVEELSDPDGAFAFTMPSSERFAAAMSRHGVDATTRVILYDGAMTMWAARVWWMLRAFGFDNAAVLNGGWHKWTLEEHPVSAAPPTYAPAQFTARPRAALIASKADVEATIEQGSTCVINALTAESYQAKRIPGSVNVSFNALLDPETRAYLSPVALREHFAKVGALDGQRVITYCGGGIAACSDAFILTLLGAQDVAVYDGSMSEWAADTTLPVASG